MQLNVQADALECVRRLLEATGGRLPVNVKSLVEKQGARLQVVKKTQKMTPAARLSTFDGLVIEVREGQPVERERQAICHELAHTFFTESADARFAIASTDGLSEPYEEHLCDVLALRILLPENGFLREVEARPSSWRSVRELAAVFQVTPLAVIERLLQLPTSPWCGVLLHWAPITPWRPFEGFKVIWRKSLGAAEKQAFPVGYKGFGRGLYTAYRTDALNIDVVNGYTLDCVGLGARSHRRVFSFATK